MVVKLKAQKIQEALAEKARAAEREAEEKERLQRHKNYENTCKMCVTVHCARIMKVASNPSEMRTSKSKTNLQ